MRGVLKSGVPGLAVGMGKCARVEQHPTKSCRGKDYRRRPVIVAVGLSDHGYRWPVRFARIAVRACV